MTLTLKDTVLILICLFEAFRQKGIWLDLLLTFSRIMQENHWWCRRNYPSHILAVAFRGRILTLIYLFKESRQETASDFAVCSLLNFSMNLAGSQFGFCSKLPNSMKLFPLKSDFEFLLHFVDATLGISLLKGSSSTIWCFARIIAHDASFLGTTHPLLCATYDFPDLRSGAQNGPGLQPLSDTERSHGLSSA